MCVCVRVPSITIVTCQESVLGGREGLGSNLASGHVTDFSDLGSPISGPQSHPLTGVLGDSWAVMKADPWKSWESVSTEAGVPLVLV